MKLKLSPLRAEAPLAIEKSGDVLIINEEPFDFSPIPEGGLLPRAAVECEWLLSDVERIDGEIQLTLMLPHGPNAPEETRFPEPIHVTNDGPIDLPPYDAQPAEAEEAEEPSEEPVEGDEEGETDGD